MITFMMGFFLCGIIFGVFNILFMIYRYVRIWFFVREMKRDGASRKEIREVWFEFYRSI
jgi:hypothetical protein